MALQGGRFAGQARPHLRTFDSTIQSRPGWDDGRVSGRGKGEDSFITQYKHNVRGGDIILGEKQERTGDDDMAEAWTPWLGGHTGTGLHLGNMRMDCVVNVGRRRPVQHETMKASQEKGTVL